MDGPSIFIAMPVLESVKAQTMKSIVKLTHAMRDADIEWQLGMHMGNSMIDFARDILAAEFLKSGASHLLFVDADMEFNADVVERMLRADVDVIGVAAAKKRIDWESVRLAAISGERDLESHSCVGLSMHPGQQLRVKDGVASVPAMGTGCMLIRRRVIEKLANAHPELALAVPESFAHGLRRAVGIFLPTIVDGVRYGEDISFCRRWTALGGEVHVLVDASIVHHGSHGFKANLTDRFLAPGVKRAEVAPANEMIESLQRIAAMGDA